MTPQTAKAIDDFSNYLETVKAHSAWIIQTTISSVVVEAKPSISRVFIRVYMTGDDSRVLIASEEYPLTHASCCVPDIVDAVKHALSIMSLHKWHDRSCNCLEPTHDLVRSELIKDYNPETYQVPCPESPEA